jgi:hypothetical protein
MKKLSGGLVAMLIGAGIGVVIPGGLVLIEVTTGAFSYTAPNGRRMNQSEGEKYRQGQEAFRAGVPASANPWVGEQPRRVG